MSFLLLGIWKIMSFANKGRLWKRSKSFFFLSKLQIMNEFKQMESQKRYWNIWNKYSLTKLKINKLLSLPCSKSHGLVFKADYSRSRGHGFEPRHHILDGCERCKLLHKSLQENNKNKGSRIGHTKKNNLLSQPLIKEYFRWWFILR